MIELPKKSGEMFVVTREYFDELRVRHRGVDVWHQLQKMRNWLDANPKKRKLDVPRFINNWLSKPGIERDVGKGSVSAAESRHPSVMAERERKAEPPQWAPESVAAAHIAQARAMLMDDGWSVVEERADQTRCQHTWQRGTYTWTPMCWDCGMFADQVLSQDIGEMTRIAQMRRGL